ncbi:MAG: hypothetical protein JRJ57_00090 [Deltaproteobacteria bacterium]|nr:hypothetical protein [Deltaproteobacteria bacterium]
MVSGIFVCIGVIIGGLITFVIQYYFRKEERKWEQRNEKKKATIEAMEILQEILELYDTFPKTDGDNNYFREINKKVRKSHVKLKLHFAHNDTRIIEAFEDANRALKSFITMEKGERIKTSKKAREKIEKFENLVENYF